MSIARITPIVGSLYGLMRNALGLNVATPLESQELSCTVAPDRRLIVLGHEPIAGFAVDHGTVADAAAMLALHTLDGATLLAEPTFVAPGDSCIRTDDPGWRWHCIAGHGTTLADWERRPLGGALDGLAVSGHTHSISAITGLQSELDDLGTAVSGKQAALDNAAALARITASPGGPPKWDGGDWPGAGAVADSGTLIAAAGPCAWYRADAGVEESDGDAAEDTDTVLRWLDQSGHGYHLEQSTNESRPIFRTAQRGALPVVRFDGSNDYLICSAFPSIDLGNCTVVWCGRHVTSAEYGRMLVIGASGSGNDYSAATRFELEAGESGQNYIAQINSVQSVLYGTRPAPAGCYHARLGRSQLIAGVDDHTYGSFIGATTSASTTGLLIGAAWSAGAIGTSWGLLAGDVFEVAVFARALGNAELGGIIAALRAKWGL